jgi:selenocysteine lyase/cysteine desulfurase
MAVTLKENMDPVIMNLREKELTDITFQELSKIKNLHILASNIRERLGVFSFYVDNVHHNLITRLLNDRFGIQVRGGCSCAGTYGHFLLDVSFTLSQEITDKIDAGDLSMKPGWIRLSLHPTMSNEELLFITDAIKQTVENAEKWKNDYSYDRLTNEFRHKTFPEKQMNDYLFWFDLNS